MLETEKKTIKLLWRRMYLSIRSVINCFFYSSFLFELPWERQTLQQPVISRASLVYFVCKIKVQPIEIEILLWYDRGNCFLSLWLERLGCSCTTSNITSKHGMGEREARFSALLEWDFLDLSYEILKKKSLPTKYTRLIVSVCHEHPFDSFLTLGL